MARYIDADALIEKIKAKATEMFTVDSVYEYYIDALIDVEDIIKSEPTADVVPIDFHERCLSIEISRRMNMEKLERYKYERRTE